MLYFELKSQHVASNFIFHFLDQFISPHLFGNASMYACNPVKVVGKGQVWGLVFLRHFLKNIDQWEACVISEVTPSDLWIFSKKNCKKSFPSVFPPHPSSKISDSVRWWVWLVGPALSLGLELIHEVIENSEWMIQRYRAASGTSQLYQGDSVENIGG